MEKSNFLGTSNVEKMIINRKRGINKMCINWLQSWKIYLYKESPIYFKTDFLSFDLSVGI